MVTAPPYYPEWKISPGYTNGWKKEQVQGTRGKEQGTRHKVQRASGETGEILGTCSLNLSPVLVYRCPLWVPEKPSGLKRILHLLSFAISSFPVMLRQIFWKPDVVFVVEPPLFCSPAALLVARLSGAKSWLHVQDFEVDAAFDLGILPKGRIQQIILAAESWLMRRFDRVSSISGKMIEKLGEKKVTESRQILFPNWVDVSSIFPLECSPMRGDLGISDDRCVCLYSGNMGEKQGLEILIEAARIITETRCKKQGERGEGQETSARERGGSGEEERVRSEAGRVVFVMCGNGGARDRLLELAQGLTNILWLPLQPLEKLNELLNMADIHLLPQRADAADLVMPSKLTGMLASGKPVIATAKSGTELAEVVSSCGRVVEPGNADALAMEIMAFADDKDARRIAGEAGRKYALDYLSVDAILLSVEKAMQCV